MKNKATALVKRVVSILSSIAKAKSLAIKNKTNAAKARLLMFSLMKNKKLLTSAISNKFHNLIGGGQHQHEDEDEVVVDGMAIVVHNQNQCVSSACTSDVVEEEEENDKYPDLTHSLFEEDDDLEVDGGSIIDMVRNSKEEEGQDFSLEEEIDHVADLFIKRFHKQIKLQKLESFKRFQEMLARGL